MIKDRPPFGKRTPFSRSNNPAVPCGPRCLNLRMQVGILSRVSAWPDGYYIPSAYVDSLLGGVGSTLQAHHAHSRDSAILTHSRCVGKVVRNFTSTRLRDRAELVFQGSGRIVERTVGHDGPRQAMHPRQRWAALGNNRIALLIQKDKAGSAQIGCTQIGAI